MESLWNLLNLRRAILLTEHGQDPFDQLDERYRVNISTASLITLKHKILRTNVDSLIVEKIKNNRAYVDLSNLHNLIDFVYRFILLKLMSNENDKRESNSNDEENEMNSNIDIAHILSAYDDYSDEFGALSEFTINEFNVENIKLENIHHFWKLLIKIYSNVNK